MVLQGGALGGLLPPGRLLPLHRVLLIGPCVVTGTCWALLGAVGFGKLTISTRRGTRLGLFGVDVVGERNRLPTW